MNAKNQTENLKQWNADGDGLDIILKRVKKICL